MINRIQLLRNIGQFDSVHSGSNIPLSKLTLIYAENGRGKTTLASILRSLSTNCPIPIQERKRLGSANDPHVVLDCDGNPANVVFQNGAWTRAIPELVVFDDLFVTENVFSGLAVEAGHRQNLHELILGAQGIALNNTLQAHVTAIEQHNIRLRERSAAIPAAVRGALTVDQFCALGARPNIEAEIRAAERNLAAARQQEPIRQAGQFEVVSLPTFDVEGISALLSRKLDDLDAESAARVQHHIASLPAGSEGWLGRGMEILAADSERDSCPFCAQPLTESSVLDHYRAYFAESYATLKTEIDSLLSEINRTHGGNATANFERGVRALVERRSFWKDFCELPEVTINSEAIAQAWQFAREAVLNCIAEKKAAPLEQVELSQEAKSLIAAYDDEVLRVVDVNQRFQDANARVALVKEQAAAGNVTALASDLARLQAVSARHEPATVALCDAYLAEQAAKAATEQLRDQARVALDQYRTNIFPTYETAINEYLRRFNAGYRLSSLTSQNTRAGSACTYNVVINTVAIPTSSTNAAPGEPSFRNTLSAGDRNTLALAFFFASLDQDPARADRIVVIDDPMTSLDEHRTLTTAQEIRRLANDVNQVIVLSHTKAFLCEIWQNASTNTRSAMLVSRIGNGSSLAVWNVSADSETEYDRNHFIIRQYVAAGTGDPRSVAQVIRPILEGFMRIACPEHFRAGSLLGPFINNVVKPRLGQPDEVFDGVDSAELESLLEYGNRFHHDTNPNWMTAAINDGELLDFARRTLAFVRR